MEPLQNLKLFQIAMVAKSMMEDSSLVALIAKSENVLWQKSLTTVHFAMIIYVKFLTDIINTILHQETDLKQYEKTLLPDHNQHTCAIKEDIMWHSMQE